MNVNPGVASSSNANRISIVDGLQLLFILKNANLNFVGDQIFTQVFTGLTWDPQFITAVWLSGTPTGSPAGGIFSLPNKGGSAIVSTGQSYSGLTGANTHVNLTVQATTTTFIAAPYFNLSTASTTPLFADVRIYGFCYD